MKLSYGGQCGHNGFMAYVGSGNRPVLSASHAGCIPAVHRTGYHHYPLCLSASHAGCIRSGTYNRFSIPLCLSASHAGCIIDESRLPIHQTVFASAHPMRVASRGTGFAGCLGRSLPQRIPCGLHPQDFQHRRQLL